VRLLCNTPTGAAYASKTTKRWEDFVEFHNMKIALSDQREHELLTLWAQANTAPIDTLLRCWTGLMPTHRLAAPNANHQ
jgi:hypothetical protein